MPSNMPTGAYLTAPYTREIVQALAQGEISVPQARCLANRALRRMPRALYALQAWLLENPYTTPNGKNYGWQMHCVSGFGMPPFTPPITPLPAQHMATLCRLFNWLVVSDLCTPGQPAPTRAEVAHALGRDL